MELRQKTNEELFTLYEGELAFRHRSVRGIHEAKRVLRHFHNYLGEYPPTPELAKSFLSTFNNRKPTTIARYAAILKVFLKWYPLWGQTNKNEAHVKFMNPIKLRGRAFSINELHIIQKSVANYYKEGRTYISRVICRKLNWQQPNGWLKDRACRDVLLHLEKIGLIKLPPALIHRSSSKQLKVKRSKSYLSDIDLSAPITKFPESIKLKLAKGNANEIIWNELVEQYHYLGHNVTVGRCIKYLLMSDSRLLGAISFSSPAWKLKPRDDALNAIGITNPHDYAINNSRFLILPIVQIPNLASHILSLATKQIVSDWNDYYSITPLIAETFVQPSRFKGTCYKAANWVEVGITKGYAKKGRFYQNSQEPKKIFLYGLDKRLRTELLRLPMVY